ncbi:MAG: hypothetical protein HXS48_14420 [Theionarchaea archaeon]|nr:hypothetical protein [Theionarchaea archaeon]
MDRTDIRTTKNRLRQEYTRAWLPPPKDSRQGYLLIDFVQGVLKTTEKNLYCSTGLW